jgi:nucleotide-binding universal stress UspA family protein
MKMLEKIVLATDITDGSESAVNTTINIAGTFGSEIIILHIIPKDINDTLISIDLIKKRVQKQLEKIQEKIRKKGIRTDEIIIDNGMPFERIIYHAEVEDANLIIIGSGNQKSAEILRLGITAERLISRSNIPVWVAKKGSTAKFNTILATVDLSNTAERLLNSAIYLARSLVGELYVLYVVRPVETFYSFLGLIEAGIEKKNIKREEDRFDHFLKKFDFSNIKWQKLFKQGLPSQEILRTVEAINSDIVMMGSVGRSESTSIYLGKVAMRVFKKLPCSLIAFKSKDIIRLKHDQELKDLESHFEYGNELLEKGMTREAVNQYKFCINMNKMFLPAFEGLVFCYERLGESEEVKKYKASVGHLYHLLLDRQET